MSPKATKKGSGAAKAGGRTTGKATAGKPGADGTKTVATNRKARHDYSIEDRVECGIALVGSEVKSLRAGHVNLQDAYARVENGEVWLHGMHVTPYEFAKAPPDPVRARKLLLRRREIDKLLGATTTQGMTLVPLRVYFAHGLAKIELGVAKGRRSYDKREALKEREAGREAERALRARTRGG